MERVAVFAMISYSSYGVELACFAAGAALYAEGLVDAMRRLALAADGPHGALLHARGAAAARHRVDFGTGE
jgi:hypothetical protein